MPQPEQLAARAQAQGRLWANVFCYMLEAGRFEVGAPGSALVGSCGVVLSCVCAWERVTLAQSSRCAHGECFAWC